MFEYFAFCMLRCSKREFFKDVKSKWKESSWIVHDKIRSYTIVWDELVPFCSSQVKLNWIELNWIELKRREEKRREKDGKVAVYRESDELIGGMPSLKMGYGDEHFWKEQSKAKQSIHLEKDYK